MQIDSFTPRRMMLLNLFLKKHFPLLLTSDVIDDKRYDEMFLVASRIFYESLLEIDSGNLNSYLVNESDLPDVIANAIDTKGFANYFLRLEEQHRPKRYERELFDSRQYSPISSNIISKIRNYFDEIIDDPKKYRAICEGMKGLSDDLFEIIKITIPLVYALAIAGEIEFPDGNTNHLYVIALLISRRIISAMDCN